MAKAAKPGVTFRLTGNRRLDRLFQTLPVKVQKKVLRKPLREAAKVIQKQAKRNAPKDTGLLRRSLRVRAGRRSRRFKNTVRIVVITGEGFFKGETFYGAFQEFGWKLGKRGTPNRRQMPALHYIERAYKAKESEARSVAMKGIALGIMKEAASAGVTA